MTTLLLALMMTLADPAAGQGAALDFVLRLDPDTGLVHAEARLAGLDGPVGLSLPESYAYIAVEPRLAGELTAQTTDGDALSVERTAPHRWRLDPGESTEAVVRWSIVLDHRRQPGVMHRDEYEHPYLADDHAMLVTGALLIVPDQLHGLREQEELRATLRIEAPDGWPVIVPWPEDAPGVYVAPNPRALADELIIAGAWDIESGEADGLEYAVAFAPGQDALADLVRHRLPAIVEAEVDLFGGAPQPKYLFVFGRPDQSSGYGGSPKQNSMTLFVAPDLPADFAAVGTTHLIAHEYHHTWMKARCDPEDELRWITEGFTDYYAHLVPWRLGHADDGVLLGSLSGQLTAAEAALSGFGGSLAAAGGPEFFEGGAAYQSCYSGGLAMALWTDLALRNAGQERGLDGLLRDFYNDPRWEDGTRPSLDHWYALLENELGAELVATQRAAVAQESGPDWIALLREIGVEAHRIVVPVQGGVRANFDGTTVPSIDPSGAGGRIGLQGGDRILTVNGVEVTSPGAVHRSWEQLVDGRLEVEYERDGERMSYAGPPPSEARYDLPRDLPERLRN